MGFELATCCIFIPDANHSATAPHKYSGSKCYFLPRKDIYRHKQTIYVLPQTSRQILH